MTRKVPGSRFATAAVLSVAVAFVVVRGGPTLAEDNPKTLEAVEIAEPDDYRMDDYNSPVPKTLKGARAISTEEAERLHKAGEAIFIDVHPKAPKPPNLPAGTIWRDPPHSTIPGAVWLPNTGYGGLSQEFETYFRSRLETLTKGDKTKAIVFYCLKNCWMSWNTGKRALAWGYTSVIWYPDGTDGWSEAGNDTIRINPMP